MYSIEASTSNYRAVSWTIRVGLAYLNKSIPPYTLLVFLEGVIVNITPPWIRAPLGKRPYALLLYPTVRYTDVVNVLYFFCV
jgi:hypothetical protein